MNNETLDFIQEQLDYQFKEPKLLRQAFTRKSYSEEHNGAYHNEVLEFYGDKALEFVVMKKLCNYFGEITQNGKYCSEKSEGQLTEIKKKLICKKMLAHRIDMLDFSEYLLMGKGDELQNVQNQESVKEDLFEAIVGAVAIDCEWDAKTLEEVIDRMIDMEYYLENGFQDDENYVDIIQNWCQKRYGCLPEYQIDSWMRYDCKLRLGDYWHNFYGEGDSKREARMNAAKEAYEYLNRNNEWYLPIDEVGVPELDRAINQLQELYQKGYIGEPWYEFSELYDEDGNPIWKCECHISGKSRYWWANRTSKKNAKKTAAYNMLCEILNWEDEDDEA